MPPSLMSHSPIRLKSTIQNTMWIPLKCHINSTCKFWYSMNTVSSQPFLFPVYRGSFFAQGDAQSAAVTSASSKNKRSNVEFAPIGELRPLIQFPVLHIFTNKLSSAPHLHFR